MFYVSGVFSWYQCNGVVDLPLIMLCVFTYLCLRLCVCMHLCLHVCACVCVCVYVSPYVKTYKELTLQLECVLHRLETRLSLAIHNSEIHKQAQTPPPLPYPPTLQLRQNLIFKLNLHLQALSTDHFHICVLGVRLQTEIYSCITMPHSIYMLLCYTINTPIQFYNWFVLLQKLQARQV